MVVFGWGLWFLGCCFGLCLVFCLCLFVVFGCVLGGCVSLLFMESCWFLVVVVVSAWCVFLFHTGVVGLLFFGQRFARGLRGVGLGERLSCLWIL